MTFKLKKKKKSQYEIPSSIIAGLHPTPVVMWTYCVTDLGKRTMEKLASFHSFLLTKPTYNTVLSCFILTVAFSFLELRLKFRVNETRIR